MTHSNPTAMSREAEAEALSIGDFGLLLQDILRQFARDVEASPVRHGMSVEEFSPRFEAMRFASQAIVTAASRLRSHPATAGGKPGEGELREAFERWIKRYGFPIDRHLSIYKNTHTAMCWNAWQASRKSATLARPVAEEPAAPVEGNLFNIGIETAAKIADSRAEFLSGSDGVRVHEARTIASSIREMKLAAPKANGVGTGEGDKRTISWYSKRVLTKDGFVTIECSDNMLSARTAALFPKERASDLKEMILTADTKGAFNYLSDMADFLAASQGNDEGAR